MGLHPHFAIEEIAAGEIEEGKGVLINGVVFEINAMVNIVLE
jgi:hypothetical protein